MDGIKAKAKSLWIAANNPAAMTNESEICWIARDGTGAVPYNSTPR